MIQAACIFFNDSPFLLERCLKSIKPHVDSILAIDGAFKDFEHDKPYSTDGCLDIAKQYADKVIEVKEPWHNQIVKRNAYLTLKDPKDYYFVIDADEYLTDPLPLPTKDYYGLKIINPSWPTSNVNSYYLRLFRHQAQLRYKRKHSWLYLKDELVSLETHNDNIVKLDTPVIQHTPELRGEKRLVQDNIYTEKRNEPNMPTEPVKLTKYQQFMAKPKPAPLIKSHKVKCVIEYSGFDHDSTQLFLKPGQQVDISEKKWNDLQEGFKDHFQLIGARHGN